MKQIVELNEGNFEQVVIQSGKPFVVDFWAEWCGPCKMLAPVLADIARDSGEVTIAKVNIDQNPELATRYNIQSIPTLLYFDRGERERPHRLAIRIRL